MATHTLVIEWTPAEGHVAVRGPLNDRATCYAMLELARDTVAKQGQQEQTSSLIARPTLTFQPS